MARGITRPETEEAAASAMEATERIVNMVVRVGRRGVS